MYVIRCSRVRGARKERRNVREKDEVLCVYYLGPLGEGLWGWDVV